MQNPSSWRLLVFGASGAIGQAVCQSASDRGFEVVRVLRKAGPDDAGAVVWNPLQDPLPAALTANGPFDAVCWAQGANMADSVADFDRQAHLDLYDANCLFVVQALQTLLSSNALRAEGARLCVVSSIWEQRARQNKLSYVMTKAAIGGFVRSAAVDLAADGHLINAILPGALDTPMTIQNVQPDQLARLKAATPFDRLTDLGSVASLACFFCSPENKSITSQSVAVDLGFSNGRIL